MAKQKQESVEQEAPVEPQAETPKPEKISRSVAAARAIKDLPAEITVGELSAIADELFVAGGGKSDISVAEAWVWSALETAEELGLVETVSVVRRQK